jgi:tetratricopeptide (TPR) repeat protein
MKSENITVKILDSPGPDELISAIDNWKKPELPGGLQAQGAVNGEASFQKLSALLREQLDRSGEFSSRKQLERLIIDWLYVLVRLNVKRGRIFDLREVIKTGQADCLGYAKVFTVLGRQCGIDTGVVEIIIDNRSEAVPHTAVMTRLAEGGRQFIDFWYGSRDIRHKRLGLSVKYDNKWKIKDIDYKDLNSAEDFSYLPDYCVDAITLYIQGNRSLKNKDYLDTISKYSLAIELYPQNARLFYNRAVAYENLGEQEKARVDYTRALEDEASIQRTLAVQPEEVVELIKLDSEGIPQPAQYIYLLHKGFITGKKTTPDQIAKKLGLCQG